AFAALVEDLHQRGLNKRVLVVAMGEFGRTPRMNPEGGRDHWRNTFSVAFAALVEDVHQRGLNKRVLVVAMGEFGRTPRMNPEGGRDHWGNTFSVAFAGGGLKTGQAVGKSNP